MRAVRRSLLAALAGTVGLATLPAMSLAQAETEPAPKSVRVRMTMTEVHAPDSVPAGRYRLGVDAPSRVPGLLQLVKPDQGYTKADFRGDLRRADRPGGRAATRRRMTKLRFFGGAVVAPGRTGALWETLYSGRYWLMAPTRRLGGFSAKTVRVHGTPTASRFPSLSAHATGTEHGLRLEREIPRTGRMLIRNHSEFTDSLMMVPLRSGTTYADFVQWLRHPSGRMPLRFRGARITAGLSPDAGYVLRYRLHPAEYVAFGLSSFSGRRIREVFQPLTVRGARRAASTRSSWQAPGGGLRKAPSLARRIEHWHATGPVAGTLGSRLDALRRSVRPLLVPSFR
jgi:hypothetical protein